MSINASLTCFPGERRKMARLVKRERLDAMRFVFCHLGEFASRYFFYLFCHNCSSRALHDDRTRSWRGE